MEVHLKVMLELIFCTHPPNFRVEAHIKAPTGVALTIANYWEDHPTAQPPHTCASVDSWPCLVGEKIVFSTF
jgi:hypothetical protein